MQMSDVTMLRSHFENMKKEAEAGLAMLSSVMAGKTVPNFVDLVKTRLNPLKGKVELLKTDLRTIDKFVWSRPIEKQGYILVVDCIQLNCITTTPAFSAFYDPVIEHKIATAGYIGRIIKYPIFTDAFLPQDQRFIHFGAGFLYCPEVEEEAQKYFSLEPVATAK